MEDTRRLITDFPETYSGMLELYKYYKIFNYKFIINTKNLEFINNNKNIYFLNSSDIDINFKYN